MWSKRLALIKKAAHGARLLDIGAGIGTFLSLARDTWACKVTGTEVSSMAVRIAQERYGIALLFGRVEDVQLPNGSFEIVTLWHVLEHLPSPAQTLDLCYHPLANDGWLAIAVPNDDDARSDTLVRAYRLANLLTGFNFGQTIFVLARKGASNRS
jgi:2-polyprenyl-3-methyl-5-hydroxy-6-metoxy-1,4-benzoquinol methylase